VNILILIGLFALGIIAILAAVLLGRDEQGRRMARVKGSETQVLAPVETHPGGVPGVAATQAQRLTVPLDQTHVLGRRDEQPANVRLDAQFHELAEQIRELYQHARELEQGLGTLKGVVDHLERVEDGHSGVDEEQPAG